MTFRFRSAALPGLTLLALSFSTASQAGGLMTYAYATPNVGLANAGAAARAQGPDTMADNIAGLSYLEGTQVSAGAEVLWSDLESSGLDTNVSGGNSGHAIKTTLIPSFFVSKQLDENWSLGFGSYSNFGTALNYDNDWAGRYFLQNGSMVGMSLVPGAAYRFNDEWSLGFGLQAMYASTDDQLAIDTRSTRFDPVADGKAQYKDSDWGYGGNLGLIYQPQPGTRIGLNYTSKIDIDFEDRLKLTPPTGKAIDPAYKRLQGTKLGLSTEVPQTVTLSLYQQLDPKWALLASTNWQQWSQFGEFGIKIEPNAGGSDDLTLNSNFDDTWHASLGAQYQATPEWLWSAGLAYDSSAVSDSKRSWALPMGETVTLGLGATVAMAENSSLNVSYSLTSIDNWTIDSTKAKPDPADNQYVNGEISNNWIQVVSASMNWRF